MSITAKLDKLSPSSDGVNMDEYEYVQRIENLCCQLCQSIMTNRDDQTAELISAIKKELQDHRIPYKCFQKHGILNFLSFYAQNLNHSLCELAMSLIAFISDANYSDYASRSFIEFLKQVVSSDTASQCINPSIQENAWIILMHMSDSKSGATRLRECQMIETCTSISNENSILLLTNIVNLSWGISDETAQRLVGWVNDSGQLLVLQALSHRWPRLVAESITEATLQRLEEDKTEVALQILSDLVPMSPLLKERLTWQWITSSWLRCNAGSKVLVWTIAVACFSDGNEEISSFIDIVLEDIDSFPFEHKIRIVNDIRNHLPTLTQRLVELDFCADLLVE